MDNVIFILIDSVYSDCLGVKRTEVSSTPFIDSLVNEGLFVPNIYSYGPYTDAATIGLYCGIPTLEKLGYFYGINLSEYNHFKLFHENGYETYGFYYPYYLVSDKTKKNVDHPIYTSGFKYSSVWGGKLEYYSEVKKKRNLNDIEYKLIEKCLDMVFECWRTFYSDIKENPESSLIVSTLRTNETEASGEKGLKEEWKKYLEDKRAYIDIVLDMGMNHPLAFVNEFDYGKKADIDFYKHTFDRNREFLKRSQYVNITKNLKNNHLNFNKAIHSTLALCGIENKKKARYIQNYGMLLAGNKMMEKRALNSRNWQEIASLNKQIETLMSVIENKKSNKPFYASLHVLEPHHNVSFFSFDSFDDDLVDEEFEYLAPLIKGCGKGFSGNLLYQLSLRYVDLCIKRLFNMLEKEGLLDSTTVALVSDHGTSYAFAPIRNTVVNTFHKENYNVPCLIWNNHLADSMKMTSKGIFCSEDILPTLGGVVNIEIPDYFKGRKMYEEEGRDYIITEYMGPGVPDMLTRDVWISIRTSKYVIAYRNCIEEALDCQHPHIIYDLINDPLEKKNYCKETSLLNNNEVKQLIAKLNERYKVIQNNTREIINNLSNLEI